MIDTKDMTTNKVLNHALAYAKGAGVGEIVVATTSGETGREAARAFSDSGIKVIAVSHSVGFRESGGKELSDQMVEELKEQGVEVLTGTMPFHGIEDSFRKSRSSYSLVNAVADTLRLMGQGTKVCAEITCMAVDAGIIEEGRDVLAVAGTHKGTDTVLKIRATPSRRFLGLKIREIVAKPSDW